MDEIQYFFEEIEFNLPEQTNISRWLKEVIEIENKTLISLNYIFCDDEYLLSINQQYLNHDYYTDILTFDQSEKPDLVDGEIYISVERIRENAKEFGSTFLSELHRVMVHGVLHLIGYSDHTDIEKQQMRKKEEACLSLQRF